MVSRLVKLIIKLVLASALSLTDQRQECRVFNAFATWELVLVAVNLGLQGLCAESRRSDGGFIPLPTTSSLDTAVGNITINNR